MKPLFLYLLIFLLVLFLFFVFSNRPLIWRYAVDFKNPEIYRSFGSYNLEIIDLANKLENLEAKLEEMESASGIRTVRDRNDYLLAEVFSRYPFNTGDRLVVGAGSEDGVREGMPVLISPRILFGRINKVSKRTSEVMTVFDPAWREAVYLGSGGAEGVLTGGRNPRVGFIEKNSGVSAGDAVENASEKFPPGLFLAEISSVADDAKDPFKEAELSFPYNPNQIRHLLIITNFNANE